MEVTLTRNSWHFRLQQFVFNDVPFQRNFCPYFWLTIFCLFALPFVGLWVLVKKPLLVAANFLLNAFESFGEAVETRICIPYQERSLNSVTPEQAFVLHEAWEARHYYFAEGKHNAMLAEKYWRWKTFFLKKFDSEEAWQKFIEEGRIKVEAMRERDKAIRKDRELIEAERKKRIQKLHLGIIKVTKVLFFGTGAVLALGLAYVIFVGIALMWANRVSIWDFVVTYGPAVIGIVFLIMAFVGLIFGAIHLGKCLVRAAPKILEEKKENRITAAIKSFFSFFWMFIVNFKKNHCPHIEWVE